MDYLLRIEAVNLGNFIYDTTDLSTIRGAGLLLLNLPRKLTKPVRGLAQPLMTRVSSCEEPERYRVSGVAAGFFGEEAAGDIELMPISVGASVALYEFQAEDADAAEALVRVIERWLAEHELYRYATILVVHGEKTDDYPASREALLAKLRFAQIRGLDLCYGPVPQDFDSPVRFCDIDRTRPSTERISEGDPDDPTAAYARANDKNQVCPSVAVRRAYGRDTKVRVYQLVGSPAALEEPFFPTWSFEELTARGPHRFGEDARETPDPLADLAGKMAVIYADGNKFGKLQQDHAKDIAGHRAFDALIRSKRRELMDGLVDHIRRNSRWQVKASANAQRAYVRTFAGGEAGETRLKWQARIETLLWGGDELIWVVPAWCALEAVELLFDITGRWIINGRPMTQAVGMVLCSHKAPIREIVELAKNLAEYVKGQLPALAQQHSQETVPPENSWAAHAIAYEVLESFDHLGRQFVEARKARRFPSVSDTDSILPAPHFKQLHGHIETLKFGDSRLAHRRLYQLANLLHRNGEEDKAFGLLIDRIVETSRGSKEAMKSQLNHLVRTPTMSPQDYQKAPFRNAAAKWHHVIELWRYVPPPMSLAADLPSSSTRQP